MSLSASYRRTGTSHNALALLSATQSFVANSKYLEAAEVTRQLKRAFPSDTFVVALNVQAEKLYRAKSPEESATFLRTIVPIIEKARESVRQRIESSQAGEIDVEKQRKSALAQVIAQYRAHAESHLKAGDYDSAIAEMQRILMLDPSDPVATTFIQKVNELKSVSGERPAKANQDAAQYDPMPATLNDLISKSSLDFDAILAKTAGASDLSTNVPNNNVDRTIPDNSMNATGAPSKRNSKTQLLVGSAFFIILAIVVSYFLTTANQPEATRTQTPGDSTATIQNSSPQNSTPHNSSQRGTE
ncbi:MAG: hypothetical protein HY961_14160 [Ignavibacteriae bacterium]|nr:hypothetical protein [Ignavibacteriota bacterium]